MMHRLLFALIALSLCGPAAAQNWTVLEPGGADGKGRVVREQATLEDAQAASSEARSGRLEAADAVLARPASAPGGKERTWTVLESQSPDGRSRVLRERATLQQAETSAYDAVNGGGAPAGSSSPGGTGETWTVLEPDGLDGQGRVVREQATLQQAETRAHDALLREEQASDAVIPAPPPPPAAAGKPRTWTVLGAPGANGASRAVQRTQTYREAEAASDPRVPEGYRVIRRQPASGVVVITPKPQPKPQPDAQP